MNPIEVQDWGALRALAKLSGIGEEKVTLLSRRAETASKENDNPLTLLLGASEGALGVLLAHWLDESAADALRQAGNSPLVIGAEPGGIQPRIGRWPVHVTQKLQRGHIIALNVSGAMSHSLNGQLASLGILDQVIAVTRYGQLLPELEQEALESTANVAAMAKVLAIVLSGERPGTDDIAKVLQRSQHLARKHGYAGGRYAGFGIWCIDTLFEHPLSVAAPADFLPLEASRLETSRNAAIRTAAALLLEEMATKAETEGTKPLAPLGGKDLKEIEDRFADALVDALKHAETLFARTANQSSESVRKTLVDVIHEWGAHRGMAGILLEYMEKLRPGTEAALFQRVKELAEGVEVAAILPKTVIDVPASNSQESKATRVSNIPWAVGLMSGLFSRLAMPFKLLMNILSPSFRAKMTVLGKRCAAALCGGVLLYGVAQVLAPFGQRFFTNLGLMVGAVVGYLISAHFDQEAHAQNTLNPSPQTKESYEIRHLATFSQGLRTWLHEYLLASGMNIPVRCRELAARLNPEVL